MPNLFKNLEGCESTMKTGHYKFVENVELLQLDKTIIVVVECQGTWQREEKGNEGQEKSKDLKPKVVVRSGRT